jgi:hypothetical protein
MWVAAVFVATAGTSLFFLSEATNHYFAWTIQPPVTAAFLGGGYLTVTTAIVLALRASNWIQVRIGVWIVATGLISILLATLLHLDKFHLHSPIWSAKFWAWAWLFLYIILVPGLIAALWTQRHQKQAKMLSTVPLPKWMRVSQRLLSGLLLMIGIALFVTPKTAEQLWPWLLTPLTARMVGSFYLAIAVSLFVAARENNYARTHVAHFAYVVFALLQIITVIRYPVVNWLELPGLLLAVVLLALFTLGTTGIRGHFST